MELQASSRTASIEAGIRGTQRVFAGCRCFRNCAEPRPFMAEFAVLDRVARVRTHSGTRSLSRSDGPRACRKEAVDVGLFELQRLGDRPHRQVLTNAAIKDAG